MDRKIRFVYIHMALGTSTSRKILIIVTAEHRTTMRGGKDDPQLIMYDRSSN